MRLGFACTVMGIDVRAHDTRKWQNNPHLCVSLDYVSQILEYAASLGINMYRLSSNVAPYYTDLTRPQFGNQLNEARSQLADLGSLARSLNIRLSMHPGQYTVLNSPSDVTYASAVRELQYAADLFDYMGQPPDNKVIVHIGGAYGDKPSALDRWIERYPLLPDNVRARLVIENDDTIFNVADALYVSTHTGVPVVFDNLHHRVNPSMEEEGTTLDEHEALARSLATWPEGQTPKTHYSDQREGEVKVRMKGKGTRTQQASVGAHADYIDPAAFAAYVERMRDLPDFDVMFEAKAKELAVVCVKDYLREHGISLLDTRQGDPEPTLMR
ncbi:MAG: UV DNA damage repair endonuclease UvsE [Chloroflexota bacterium]